MFIAHGEWLRKHSRWILGGILVILVPGFIALFTKTGGTTRKEEDLPTIRGKKLNPAEYDNARSEVLEEYLVSSGRVLSLTPETEDEVKRQVVARIVLMKKAAAMGVRVTDEELLSFIRSRPVFLAENGQFDPDKYNRFAIYLNNYGLSETRFEQLMRSQLMVTKLQALIGAAAKVTPAEVQLAYTPLHELVSIDYVSFDAADYKEPVEVTDDEAKAYYEANKKSFRIPKQVQVRYAQFSIEGAKPNVKITDEDVREFYDRSHAKYTNSFEAVKDTVRADLATLRAQRIAGDRATAFTVKLVPEPDKPQPDFEKLAVADGATIGQTEFFAPSDVLTNLHVGSQFNLEAFALDPKERPFSDPVEGRDAYYVLQYLNGKPTEIPPFEQVKVEVVDHIKRQRVLETTLRLGQAMAEKIHQAMVAGKTFAAACADLKLKITSPPPFTLTDERVELPGAGRVQEAALGMATNAVSPFIRTSTGGLFFCLKDRQPPDPAVFDKDKARYTAMLLQKNRQAVFQFWVSSLLREEQVTFGTMHSRQTEPVPEEQEPVEQPATTPAVPPSS